MDDHRTEDEAELRDLRVELTECIKDRNNLRGLFEHVMLKMWDLTADISWEDWQNEAEKRGILVMVPATDEFTKEWGTNDMLVWAWSDRALDSDTKE